MCRFSVFGCIEDGCGHCVSCVSMADHLIDGERLFGALSDDSLGRGDFCRRWPRLACGVFCVVCNELDIIKGDSEVLKERVTELDELEILAKPGTFNDGFLMCCSRAF